MSTPIPSLGNKTPEQLKVTELREELKKRGINNKGLKKDLVERLDEALRQEAAESQEEPSKKISTEEVSNAVEGAVEGVEEVEFVTPKRGLEAVGSDVNNVLPEEANDFLPNVVESQESPKVAELDDDSTDVSLFASESQPSLKDEKENESGPDIVAAIDARNDDKVSMDGNEGGPEEFRGDQGESGKPSKDKDEIMLEVVENKETEDVERKEVEDVERKEVENVDGHEPEVDITPEMEIHTTPTDAPVADAAKALDMSTEAPLFPEDIREVISGEENLEDATEETRVEPTDSLIEETVSVVSESTVVTETTVVVTETTVVVDAEPHISTEEVELEGGSFEPMDSSAKEGSDKVEEESEKVEEGSEKVEERSDNMEVGSEKVEEMSEKVEELSDKVEYVVEANRSENEGMDIDHDEKRKVAKDEVADFDSLAAVKRRNDDESGQQEPAKRQRRWNSEKTAGRSADAHAHLEVQESAPRTFVPPTALSVPAARLLATTSTSTSKASATSSSPSGPALSTKEVAVNGEVDKTRQVPPSLRPPTLSLKIDRFVRPFTIKAVRELLEQTGTVKEMWMDQIKTHCYVTFSAVEEAVATRNALYHLRWPVAGGELLVAEFVESEEVKLRTEASNGKPLASPTTPHPGSGNVTSHAPSPASMTPSAAPATSTGFQRPAHHPPAPRERPGVPSKKEPEPPIPTLDDLYKKTRTKPQIYFLPLTEEQVAAKFDSKQNASRVPVKL